MEGTIDADSHFREVVVEEMKELKEFKIRASGIGDIMGVKGLGKTGETFCSNWLKESLYDRRKNFKNKYTEKGIVMEDEAIQYVKEQLGWREDITKNDEWFEDDYFTGTPDILIEEESVVIDIKNSYDCYTFPLFETEIPTKGYDYQLQAYMALTGYEKAYLVYVLMDAPLDIMKAEMRRLSWAEGLRGEIPDELYQKVKQEMTYSHLPAHLRIKIFEVVRDEKVIKQIKGRVDECRSYIEKVKLK